MGDKASIMIFPGGAMPGLILIEAPAEKAMHGSFVIQVADVKATLAYAAAKSAIVGMTLAMARDLAGIAVRAMAIAPGPIWTPRLGGAPEALKDALIGNVAFPKRFGQPEEFASLIEAFVRTPFLNGQTVRLDGAMSTPLTNLMGKP
ncbi:SDR family oxidoreductase [Novosphingobium flavum]|uniref:SDR family oxidoreductase n=2 Tax=Novosphingobium aerophilum TaxID=2839843 RepID=A0A7X1KB75_9SPHN|nr:SDR family oxidoreductase [Novosphingobium aerophilum]